MSLAGALLRGRSGRSSPDWVALVQNKVSVILDHKNDILLGSGIGVPDSFVVMGAAHNSVSHKGLAYEDMICRKRIGRWE